MCLYLPSRFRGPRDFARVLIAENARFIMRGISRGRILAVAAAPESVDVDTGGGYRFRWSTILRSRRRLGKIGV